MFAVPGWSVSAASLKAETTGKGQQPQRDEGAGNKPGKRKRDGPRPSNVDSTNVAELWERVIEGKSRKRIRPDRPRPEGREQDDAPVAKEGGSKQPKGKKLKQPKREPAPEDEEAAGPAADEESGEAVATPQPQGDKEKKRKKGKKAKGSEADQDGNQHGDGSKPKAKPAPSSETARPAALSAPAPKLTPMQAAMREKLVSARFRHLNETLYTKPSADSFELFEESPEMFQEYHEGFRRQVEVWPENPVDGFLKDIKLRARQKAPQRSKNGPPPASSGGVPPLLRTQGVCTIADLGCGDAKLSHALEPEKKKLGINVLSYDLQSPSPLVTKADIANLPVEDGAVNVAIFCLALMGTNWLDFIEEAYRILHWKGELWIAEIKSRFAPPSRTKKGPVTHSVGGRKKQQQPGKKAKGPDPEVEAAEANALAVEVDGADDKRQETDVTAFVEALRKRGFLLRGEGSAAVDLSNKMFVRMHFVKAAEATVGKAAVAPREHPGRGGMKRPPPKFIDGDKPAAVDEGSILKPCVYKIR